MEATLPASRVSVLLSPADLAFLPADEPENAGGTVISSVIIPSFSAGFYEPVMSRAYSAGHFIFERGFVGAGIEPVGRPIGTSPSPNSLRAHFMGAALVSSEPKPHPFPDDPGLL